MSDDPFASAVRALAVARRDSVPVTPLPPAWTPPNADAAYRLQRAVVAELGEAIRGWKIGALTPAAQASVGLAAAASAPLLDRWFQPTPATWPRASFIAPIVECEFAFELCSDLPPRAEPYSRPEVEAAIGALRIAIELVDRRIPPGSGVLSELADAFNNGAFVLGPATADWRSVDYANHAMILRALTDGASTELARGSGRATLDGDPVGAVVLLANAQPRGHAGLQRGHVVTTGSCANADALPGAATYEANFGALGRVTLQLT